MKNFENFPSGFEQRHLVSPGRRDPSSYTLPKLLAAAGPSCRTQMFGQTRLGLGHGQERGRRHRLRPHRIRL